MDTAAAACISAAIIDIAAAAAALSVAKCCRYLSQVPLCFHSHILYSVFCILHFVVTPRQLLQWQLNLLGCRPSAVPRPLTTFSPHWDGIIMKLFVLLLHFSAAASSDIIPFTNIGDATFKAT